MADRGRPFEPGNKFGRGRPKGSRNKKTVVAQQLLDSHAESLVRKCLVLALQGDLKAMQLCIERILPVRRDAPVHIGQLLLRTAADISKAIETVTQKVASGRITPTEGQGVARLLDSCRHALETENLEQRVRALEGQSCSA